MFKVERGLNEIENGLSLISAFPGVGTAAGLGKMMMGSTQATAAVASAAFLASSTLIIGASVSYKHPKNHFKHGGANIIAGAIESIPGVQTVFYLVRHGKHKLKEGSPLYIAALEKTKFMAYDSQQLYLFRGSDREKVAQANSLLRSSCGTFATASERLNLMKEIQDAVLSGKGTDNEAHVPLLASP